jgi:choline dehydrogenase-like flavoprotein
MKIVDARDVPRGSVLRTTLAIVGSGAAGISLALQFCNKRIPVVLLESGGVDEESDTEALSRARMDGTILDSGFWPKEYAPEPAEGYLARSRRRFFGGSTNAWGGWCRPFDPLDFQVRDWVPDSGWPITKADLDPYYRRAAAVCQITPFEEGTYHEGWEGRPALPPDRSGLRTKVVYMSPPTKFGTVYRKELVDSSNVRICTHANVAELETTSQADRVTRARIRTLSGNAFHVEADRFVLATGSVENARLLLLSDRVQKAGLGNGSDMLGRCYMDHAYVSPGYMLATTDPAAYGLYSRRYEKSLGHDSLGVFCLDEEVQRRERLQNVWITLGSPSHLEPYAPGPEEFALFQAFHPSLCAPGFLPTLVTLTASAECSPNRASRVTLDSELDALGCRRARVDWRLNDSDCVSVRRSLDIIGRALARQSMGRVRVLVCEEDPFPRAWGGTHHSGTTRMSSDPRNGVVDADCCLHQVKNLYAVGGSVFPTLGSSNPTFTIVALALRLADHLQKTLQ